MQHTMQLALVKMVLSRRDNAACGDQGYGRTSPRAGDLRNCLPTSFAAERDGKVMLLKS